MCGWVWVGVVVFEKGERKKECEQRVIEMVEKQAKRTKENKQTKSNKLDMITE